MRLAVLADLHGNLPALEAVRAELERHAPDHVIVAGDLVNRCPQNHEVVSIVVENGWEAIVGNHDSLIHEWMSGSAPAHWYDDPWHAPLGWLADRITGWSEYLGALPFDARVDVDGTSSVRVFHASPRSTREGIGRQQTDSELAEIVAGVPEPLVVCAHTHRPVERRVDDRRIVNVGAVGVPFNGDPRAQYGLFTLGHDGEWDVDLRAVEYDREAAIAAFDQTGYVRSGTVARIFLYELLSSRSHLYRFERWAEDSSLPKDDETWGRFLSRHSA